MTELPTTFGKYYLTEKLATGGMAEIFLGKLIGPGGFEKRLVIKQIHPALTGQRHFVDLFVAEAKTLVGLAHGNIVPLYELGVIDDTYFIAMEYIDGPTLWRLSEAMARKGLALDPGLALFIAAELAKGLDYAHRKGAGVIHRDLSPRNVMLSRDGEVKLVDFGIAVTYGGGSENDPDEGMPTGSFPYMSPEQVARRPLTGQSDLFSLGVLLWEMLTGERLFARATAEETLEAVTGGPIPAPSSRRSTVPTSFDPIVLRCLERDASKRWGDAGELLSALNRALYAREPPPGARDVAAVVARYCPPLGRADVETSAGADGAAEDSAPGPSTEGGGPSTKVMEGSRPQGKRKPTVREATFATNIEFEKVLSRATPLVPLRAIMDMPDEDEDDEDDDDDDEKTRPSPSPSPRSEGDARERERGSKDAARDERPSTRRAAAGVGRAELEAGGTSGMRWWLVALAVVALGAGGWWVLRGRSGGVTGPDAAPTVADARSSVPPLPPLIDAGVEDAGPPSADARPPSPSADARLPTPSADARLPTPSADARPPSPSSDAALPPPIVDAGTRMVDAIDAAAMPGRTGRLTVGAVPWGEVYLDGKRLPGTAPRTWTVPAGPHQVDVVFPATEDEPEIRRRFDVDVPPGGEQSVSAEFTR